MAEHVPAVQPDAPAPPARPPGAGLRQAGKNALWLIVSFTVLGITQFGILGLITRFAGPEEAGIWAYANAFRDPFLALMDFGTTGLLVAEIARRRQESDALLGNGLTLGLIVGVPVLGAMMAAAHLDVLQLPDLTIQAIYWTGLGALLFTTAASFRSAFRAHNRLQYEAIASIVIMAMSVVGAFVVLYYRYSFVWVFVTGVLARLAALAGSWWIYNRRIGHIRLRFHLPILRQLLSKTWAFTIVGLLTKAFTRVDILILAFFHGAAAAGYYGLATTIFYQLNTVAQLVTTAILPDMAHTYAQHREGIGAQLDAAVRVQILAGLPCTAIGLILAPQIIRFLYGRGYDSSAFIFQLLVLVVVLRFINQTLGVTLTAMDEQARRAATLTLTVLFNLGANFALIPAWGAIGATLTAVLSEFVLFVLTFGAIAPAVRRRIHWGQLLRPLASTLVVAPLVYALRDWPLLLALAVSGSVYILLVFLFKTFSAEETRSLVSLVERVGPVPAPIRRQVSSFMRRCARENSPAL